MGCGRSSSWVAPACAIAISATGCYASHERDASGAARDAGAVEPDGRVSRDAGGDAAPEPLPIEPEPDPGPDGRPSDDPGSGGWVDPDPSRYPPDEPGVVPLGDAVRIDFPGGGRVAVDLEWDGRRWGLLYSDSRRALFVPLLPLGSPDGAHVDLGLTRQTAAQLVWAAGRFLVGMSTGGTETGEPLTATAGFLDARGVRASEWNTFMPASRIAAARFVHGDQWMLGWLAGGDVLVRALDSNAHWLGEPLALTTGDSSQRVRMGGLKSRAVAFRLDDDGVVAHILRVPLADDARTSHPIFGPGSGGYRIAVGGAAFRDVALAVRGHDTVDGTPTPQLRVAAFNPWDPSATLHALIDVDIGARAMGEPSVTGDAASGLIAICVPVDTSTPTMTGTDILVYLLGPHLERLGAVADVGALSPTFPADTACEVAFSPSGILVAWWSATETEVWVRPLAPAAR